MCALSGLGFYGAFTMNHRDQENEYDDIDDFLQAIWLQKLSDNTLAAYRRDLIKTERWLRGNSKNLISASGIDYTNICRISLIMGLHLVLRRVAELY